MNYFKICLFSILFSIFIVGQHSAQFIITPKPMCGKELIPELYVWYINYDDNQVVYNKWNFDQFKRVQLEARANNKSNTTIDNNPHCPTDFWIIVPDGHEPLEACNTLRHGIDYDLRVGVWCKDSIIYTQIRTFTYMEQSDRLLSETNKVDFEFYPQPALDYLHIESKTDQKINTVTIYNSNGQLLLTNENKDNLATVKIKVAELETGLYTASIKLVDQSEYFRKLIIHSKEW